MIKNHVYKTLGSRAAILVVFVLPLLTFAVRAEANEQSTGLSSQAPSGDPKRAPWRGSQLVYRNTMGTATLDRSYQTWNPNWTMLWSFQPRWWFGETFYAGARLDLSRELTESDYTTYRGETMVSDLSLAVGASRFYTIPVLGVDLSADLSLRIPSSKVSQARTLALALGPGFRMARSLSVLHGLGLGYTIRISPLLHRYTTAQRETPLIRGCSSADGGCDAYLNTGIRNPMLRLSHTLDVTLGITSWLYGSVVVGQIVDWLYPLSGSEVELSTGDRANTDQRFASLFQVEFLVVAHPALEVAVGYNSTSPQLAPDSSYYNPFYNPYSSVYLDLRLNVEGLVSQFSGRETERRNSYDL